MVPLRTFPKSCQNRRTGKPKGLNGPKPDHRNMLLSGSCTLRAQQNAPRTSSTNGKTINYNLTVFFPPAPIQPDPARLNQESAINCAILFLSKLHQGDIKGAAAATEDPDTQVKMYEAYKSGLATSSSPRWLEDGLVHQSPELKKMMELVNARAEGKLQFK
jgi:hypothetical protein